MGEKMKRKLKYEIIADLIMDEIKNGKWKVGDKLPPESKLVAEYNVSRVCLRESLKKLNVMGVLRITQGDGTYVNEVVPSEFMKPLYPMLAASKSNIVEIYDARTFLEGGAAYIAANNCQESDVLELQEIIEQMDEAISFNNYIKYSVYDRAFHNKIVEVSKNGILKVVDGIFSDLANECVENINQNPQVVMQSMVAHRQLLWAIKDGNSEFAMQLMINHLQKSKKILLSMLEKKG